MNAVVDGLMTSYTDLGEGKIVLFLHGWGSNEAVFQDVRELLSKKYRCVSLNLPGFGLTDEPPKPWSVQNYTDFVKQFLAKLKIKDTYAIVGHSFGGRIMLKGLVDHQLSARKLIFLDTAGVKNRATPRSLLFMMIAKIGKAVFSLPGLNKSQNKMRNRLYGAAGAKDFVNAGSDIMKETFKKAISEDLKDNIAKITQDSLVIWGSDDQETPISNLEYYKQNPHMKIHVLDGGHYIFLDQPERVNKLIGDFL